MLRAIFWAGFFLGIVPAGVAALPAYARQQQQQGAVVSGRVTLDGKTSAGVEVLLLTDGVERRNAVGKTLTDAEGRFRLNVEAAGRYRVLAVSPAYVSPNAQSIAKVITVAPGDKLKDTDFALVRGGVITGQMASRSAISSTSPKCSERRASCPPSTRTALSASTACVPAN